MQPTRRHFCATAAALTLVPHLSGQTSSRVSVAAIEHDRVMAEAATALKISPRSLTAVVSAKTSASPHNFYSEPESLTSSSPASFRSHADALAVASADIAVLTSAYVLSRDDRFALHAGKHLFAWFVDPATRITSTMSALQLPASISDLAPLAEIARAIPFLVDTAALNPLDLITARAWFKEFLDWLNTARPALIAREAKDHTASAWVLLSAAIARLLGDEATLTACRNRFQRPTLRNQITANGNFPHEVSTLQPYRNSLLNFDLLAGACELLSTPFSSLWTFELDDGPGMRAVAAFLFPFIDDPARWPYLADAVHFRDVIRRRPALLLAGRAYARPEYVELWSSLPAPSRPQSLDLSFPIRQPLLWVTRPPHSV